MSLSTYSAMKTAIANWLDRSDLTAYIADFITLAEERIWRTLRVKAQETALNSTISSGVIAVPADYVELKFAYIDGAPTRNLERVALEEIYTRYPTRSTTGKPSYIAREGDNFIFGPYPDSTYTVKGIYYAKLAALSNSNTSNWLTTSAPSLLLFGSLCEAAPFVVDDMRVPVWEAKFQQTLREAQRADSREGLRGSAITMSSWSMP